MFLYNVGDDRFRDEGWAEERRGRSEGERRRGKSGGLTLTPWVKVGSQKAKGENAAQGCNLRNYGAGWVSGRGGQDEILPYRFLWRKFVTCAAIERLEFLGRLGKMKFCPTRFLWRNFANCARRFDPHPLAPSPIGGRFDPHPPGERQKSKGERRKVFRLHPSAF